MQDDRKMPTYEELVAEHEPFIGPPQPPKMQMLLSDDEKQKIRDYAKQLVDDHMSKEANTDTCMTTGSCFCRLSIFFT